MWKPAIVLPEGHLFSGPSYVTPNLGSHRDAATLGGEYSSQNRMPCMLYDVSCALATENLSATSGWIFKAYCWCYLPYATDLSSLRHKLRVWMVRVDFSTGGDDVDRLPLKISGQTVANTNTVNHQIEDPCWGETWLSDAPYARRESISSSLYRNWQH